MMASTEIRDNPLLRLVSQECLWEKMQQGAESGWLCFVHEAKNDFCLMFYFEIVGFSLLFVFFQFFFFNGHVR